MRKVLSFTLLVLWGSMGYIFAQKQGGSLATSYFGAQQFCGVDNSKKLNTSLDQVIKQFPKPSIQLPRPCPGKSTIVVNINVHWVLRSDGSGNFTEEGDNLVYPGIVNGSLIDCERINGYNRAKMLVERVNRHWKTNAVSTNFYPPAPPAALDTRIRFNLKSVNFIRDDQVYDIPDSDWSILGQYGINIWREVNIFMMEPTSTISGIASDLGGQQLQYPLAMKVYHEWQDYVDRIDPPFPPTIPTNDAADPCYTGGNTGVLHGGSLATKIISHEFGHLFSLIHNTTTAACYDIPPHNNNSWTSGFNNVMDYTGHIPYAITPCQINKMRTVLEGEARLYISNCDSCIEAHACLDAPEAYCMDILNTSPPLVDGTGSINEAQHIWWLWEVANVGDWAPTGPVWKGIGNSQQWTPGSAGIIDFRTIAPNISDILPNKVYRVLLAVQNYDANGNYCTQWRQDVAWIETFFCTLASPGPQKRLAQTFSVPIQLFPNPTQGRLHISHDLSMFTEAQAEVYNLAGQRVFFSSVDVNDSRSSINLDGLAAGAYFLRLQADGQAVAHEKVIIGK